MIKRKRKLIFEVICICINYNFFYEFKDDVKWVLYSKDCYRILENWIIIQVFVIFKKFIGIDRVFMFLRVKYVEYNNFV